MCLACENVCLCWCFSTEENVRDAGDFVDTTNLGIAKSIAVCDAGGLGVMSFLVKKVVSKITNF